MKFRELHPLKLGEGQAREVQRSLAPQVSRSNEVGQVRLVAGVDISPLERGRGRGAAVVLSYPELETVEIRLAQGEASFPYIPGLLAFRELPLILAACTRLTVTPDLLLVDGQGIAHPRRLGIASHLGLFLDTPAIGCAKSVLTGRHHPIAEAPGSQAELVDNDEVIGAALRTRAGTTPVYVSIGHKVDLAAAVGWVMNCCRGYRLPEPLRLAHLAATGKLSETVREGAQQARLF